MRTAHYGIIIHKLSFHKFSARWVPRQLTGVHKLKDCGYSLEIPSALWYRGEWISPEFWLGMTHGTILWMWRPRNSQNSHSTYKPKKFKYYWTKKLWLQCFGTIKKCLTDFMVRTRDHKNFRGLLWDTENTLKANPKQTWNVHTVW